MYTGPCHDHFPSNHWLKFLSTCSFWHWFFCRPFSLWHAGHCQSDWIVNENNTRCYKYEPDSKSWDESEAYCKDHGGHLASLSSVKELKFVQDLCRINRSGCWIGGRANSSAAQGWTWSDNESQHNDSFFPKVQCGNAPCNNRSDSCSLLSTGVAINAVACKNSHAFVCMADIGINWFLLVYFLFSCSEIGSSGHWYLNMCLAEFS